MPQMAVAQTAVGVKSDFNDARVQARVEKVTQTHQYAGEYPPPIEPRRRQLNPARAAWLGQARERGRYQQAGQGSGVANSKRGAGGAVWTWVNGLKSAVSYRCRMSFFESPGLSSGYELLMIFRFLLIAIVLIAFNVHAKEVFSGKVTYVTDGDTLWVQPDAGGPPRKLRIDGIDAPEICQSGGEAAHAVLAQHALHQRVAVTVRRYDTYGRGLARIRLNGRDLGAQMVVAGQAWSYHWHRHPGPYAAEEAVAWQSRRGLFALGQPELPRDFRLRHGPCHPAK